MNGHPKNRIILVCAGLWLIGSGCASLKSSESDLQSRYRGSYTCDQRSREKNSKENPAEADQARIRCVRDSWKLDGDRALFTRTLFQQKNCTVELGKVVSSSRAEYSEHGIVVSRSACQLVRTNVSWLGEESGACSFNSLELNKHYPFSKVAHLEKCARYLPESCFGAGPSNRSLSPPPGELTVGNRFPISALSTGGNSCQRYDSIE